LNAVFLCDKTWHIQAFMQCSPELPLEKGMDLTAVTEQGPGLRADFGPRCRLELTFPQWNISVRALIRSYPRGNLVLITTDQVAAESMRVAEVYEDAVEWARDRMEGLFHNEYYLIQQLNNQLVDSKRALARSNGKLHQALEEVEKTNQELEKAEEAARRAMEIAEKANRSKSAFLANMSHDIRTPMNGIIGLASIMAQEPGLTAKQAEYLEKIQLSGRHLLGLINDILDISKIESNDIELVPAPLNLNEQIRQIENIIRPQAAEKQQTFTIQAEISHPDLVADGVRLRQVLLNLLSNAVKYTPSGGKVSLEIMEQPGSQQDKAQIQIVVSDNGYGMTPEFQQKIFEPFSRESSVIRQEIQGTGLGMAITKTIVDLMKGQIHLESAPGAGSRFTVTLELPIAEVSASSAPQNQPSGHSLAGMRFLCAEDNELNAEILSAMLEMLGASCTIYPDGQALVDAFAAVKPGDYTAILMDIQMPNLNGLEATKILRRGENPLGKTIPIIAMTANAFAEEVRQCLDAGMNAHVAKPLDVTVLERTVREILMKISRGGEKTSMRR